MRREPLLSLPAALLHANPRGDGRYVMGIDGGATKTLAAVLDLDTKTVHLARGGPSNEDAIGTRAAVQTLLTVADEALASAGIAEQQLAAAVLAVAGTDTAAIAEQVRTARTEEWVVVNDVVGAWAAATGGRPGVGVISGTGSNVFGVGVDGRAWRAGGWGHLLGDEGSGYWFGAESIRAALHDRDGSGPATALSDAAASFFGTDTVQALAPLVYAKPLTKGQIAAFATETQRLAEQGDEVALELYHRGARELAAQIGTVIEHTGLGEGDGGGDGGGGDGGAKRFPVGLIGSGFRAGAIFIEPLADAVHELAPGAELAVVEMPPVGGSLELAARACARDDGIDAGELARLLDDELARSA